MKAHEIFFWSGLISWVLACICISAIGIKNSTWFGKYKPVHTDLKTVDVKIAKSSAILFAIGIFFFVLGFWFE